MLGLYPSPPPPTATDKDCMMSGPPQKEIPSQQPSLVPPPRVPTQSSRIPQRMSLGTTAPFTLSTPAYSPIPNSPAQFQPSSNSPLPTTFHQSSTLASQINISVPRTLRNIVLPSQQQQLHTIPLDNNVPSPMTQDVHSVVNGLSDSLGTAVTGAGGQPENTAVEVPAENIVDEVDLYDPHFLDDFLPGGIYHDEFYPNLNQSSQNQLSGIDSDPTTGDVPVEVHSAGDHLAEDQSQQSIFGDPAARDNAPGQSSNSNPVSGEHQTQSQYAEGSSDTRHSLEELINHYDDLCAGNSFARGPGQLLGGQEHSSTATDGFSNGMSQAAVDALQNAPSQSPRLSTSDSSSHPPLQVQTSAVGQAPRSVPSENHGESSQQETRWVDDIFQHRLHQGEDWSTFHSTSCKMTMRELTQ